MQDIFFAPQLYIPAHTHDISFYEKAFGAKVLRLFMNDDDSIHVAEMQIGDALFHLHEAMPGKYKSSCFIQRNNGKHRFICA